MKNRSEAFSEIENVFVEEKTEHPFCEDEEKNILLNMGRKKKEDEEDDDFEDEDDFDGAEEEEDDQPRREQSRVDRQDPTSRIVDEADEGEGQVHLRGPCERRSGEIQAPDLSRHGQQLLALMLQRPLAHVLAAVGRLMVRGTAPQRREAHGAHARHRERVDVRPLRHPR